MRSSDVDVSCSSRRGAERSSIVWVGAVPTVVSFLSGVLVRAHAGMPSSFEVSMAINNKKTGSVGMASELMRSRSVLAAPAPVVQPPSADEHLVHPRPGGRGNNVSFDLPPAARARYEQGIRWQEGRLRREGEAAGASNGCGRQHRALISVTDPLLATPACPQPKRNFRSACRTRFRCPPSGRLLPQSPTSRHAQVSHSRRASSQQLHLRPQPRRVPTTAPITADGKALRSIQARCGTRGTVMPTSCIRASLDLPAISTRSASSSFGRMASRRSRLSCRRCNRILCVSRRNLRSPHDDTLRTTSLASPRLPRCQYSVARASGIIRQIVTQGISCFCVLAIRRLHIEQTAQRT